MKIHEPSVDKSFIGYVKFIQQELDRKLTEKEMKFAMQNYITSVKVQTTLEELK